MKVDQLGEFEFVAYKSKTHTRAFLYAELPDSMAVLASMVRDAFRDGAMIITLRRDTIPDPRLENELKLMKRKLKEQEKTIHSLNEKLNED